MECDEEKQSISQVTPNQVLQIVKAVFDNLSHGLDETIDIRKTQFYWPIKRGAIFDLDSTLAAKDSLGDLHFDLYNLASLLSEGKYDSSLELKQLSILFEALSLAFSEEGDFLSGMDR